MPNTEFLEKYPLYRKFYFDIPYKLDYIEEVNINMYCEKCESNQTFNMETDYSMITAFFNNDSSGQVVLIRYLCAHCNKHRRIFIIRIDKSRKYIEKVGQYPAWDISVELNIQKVLGEYLKFFKNGLICESQGYGIGAYIYYRRVIEGVIDDLLDMILQLMNEDEKQEYKTALREKKKSKSAQEKIALVKDLLPKSLLPEQYNPLKTLHGILSEGIHEKDDEECLKDAEIIREIITYLIKQINKDIIDQKEYTENMKKLLDKKMAKKLQSKQNIANTANVKSVPKINKLFSQFIKIFEGGKSFTKGEVISIVREVNKPNFLKYLNLDFIDQGNLIVLRNSDYDMRFLSPSIPKPYNFFIIKPNLKVNNVYRNNPEDYGNEDIKIQFLDYLKKSLKIK